MTKTLGTSLPQPCCHVSGAGEWLDGAVGEGGVEENRQEGGQEDMKVCRRVWRGVRRRAGS